MLDILAIATAWIVAGLLVPLIFANGKDSPMPLERDLKESFDGAHHALLRMETTAQEVLAGTLGQTEARSLIERELATLNDYTGNLVALLGTVTTPPPYYPARLTAHRLTCTEPASRQALPSLHY